MQMKRVHTSHRRAVGLKPGDYDHEITLLDYDGALGGRDDQNQDQGSSIGAAVSHISTEQRLLGAIGEEEGAESSTQTPSRPEDSEARLEHPPSREQEDQQELPHPALRPSIEVQEPTPHALYDGPSVVPKKPHVERETAIDILYENERGGFLCGRPLFSAAALGGLDPTPWTNAYHKPSPTSIHTAQVPDPTWEWVWSEWHINHQEGMDEDGWEYSFAFGKSFSWHGPRWYNSFVRRRAWTRKRAKKKERDISVDPHMSNGDYFVVRPASERVSWRSQPSLAGGRVSRAPSHSTLGHASNAEMQQVQPDIEDLETLLQRLRFARIDREKLEAAKNYLDNAMDMANLHEAMHEIMALFVFQASRRLLLSHLMAVYDDTAARLEQNDNQHDRERRDALKQALEHADEEVRRLAYWSDVKQMAESGESRGAAASHQGWQEEWRGIDQSGPCEPNGGKLPGS